MELIKRNYVKYGLLMCGVLVACLISMQLTGTYFDSKSPIFVFYQFVAPLIVWWLGIKAYKKELGGKLTFKQGVYEGFRMSLVFGIVSPFIFLAFYMMVPEVLDYMRAAYGMPDIAVSFLIAMDMAIQFVASIIGGTIYALVPAFFLKTKK